MATEKTCDYRAIAEDCARELFNLALSCTVEERMKKLIPLHKRCREAGVLPPTIADTVGAKVEAAQK